MTDTASLSICFSSDPCKIWLLRSVRDCHLNNWLRETMGATVFIGFPTTDILNWFDVASLSSTICMPNRKRKSQSPHGRLSSILKYYMYVMVNRLICWFGPIMVITAKSPIIYQLIKYHIAYFFMTCSVINIFNDI